VQTDGIGVTSSEATTYSQAQRPVSADSARTPGQLLPLALIFVVILLGSWIRVANIGVHEFNNDELDHYFAAQSLNAGGGFELPSGREYVRGKDLTRMVALTIQHVEDPELASRLPAAVFGIISLIVFAVIAWRIGGPWVSLAATLLLAIYPEAVIQSRQTRFYTYQLVFGLVAMYAGWHLVRDGGARTLPGAASLRRQMLWMAVALIALMMALRVQVTTLSVGAGFGVALALASMADLHAHRRAAWRFSLPLWVTAIGLGGVLLLLITSFDTVSSMYRLATYVPIWAGGTAGNPLSYYRFLNEVFPIFVALAPVIFLLLAFRSVRLAVYLAVWFAVPFLLHSLLFAWKGERFIIAAVPALLLASAIVLVEGMKMLYMAVHKQLAVSGAPRLSRPLSGVLIAAIALFALAATPAFNQARKAPSGALTVQQHNWTVLGRVIAEQPDSDRIPLGSSEALSALFYWERVDFTVLKGAIEYGPGDGPAGRMRSVQERQGVPDFYSGVPALTLPDAIREHYAGQPAVLIGIDNVRWEHGSIEPSLMEVLRVEGEELCRGRCGNMQLFRWTFHGASTPSSASP
jgi:hypothetical protein